MIQAQQMFKQLVDFNKESIITVYNTMSIIQRQTERMTNSILDQAHWMPNEGRIMINEWSKAYKKSIEDYKNNMETECDKINDLIT